MPSKQTQKRLYTLIFYITYCHLLRSIWEAFHTPRGCPFSFCTPTEYRSALFARPYLSILWSTKRCILISLDRGRCLGHNPKTQWGNVPSHCRKGNKK